MLHADSAHRIAALLLAEEFDDLSAPPADAPRLRALAFLALFLAVALHAARDTGSLATSAPVPPRWTTSAQQDPTKRVHGMAHKNTLTKAAAAAALSIGSLATAQDAVQWRVEDGGNGHWYASISAHASWTASQSAAANLGGHLVTLRSTAESDFVKSKRIAWGNWGSWCWYGGRLDCVEGAIVSCESCTWRWVTGEPLDFTDWSPFEPNCGFPTERIASMGTDWADLFDDYPITHAIMEWSADCNNDGIVDFGQIRAGELDDANGNNIPDCCEGGASCNCPGDVIPDGVVDGVDLAAVLGQWGSAGDKSFSADANGDGTVDAGDLSIVLNGWGACP